MRTPRSELFQKCLEIQSWFGDATLRPGDIEKLRHWGRMPALGAVSYKQFYRHVLNPSPRGHANAQTVRWICQLHDCIAQDPADAGRQELEQLLGVPQMPRQLPSKPALGDAVDLPGSPKAITHPRQLTEFALAKARSGLHESAWRGLKMDYEHYVSRDFDFAMALAPTLIYLAYRYFSVSRISEAASTILLGLSEKTSRHWQEPLRTLCLTQLGAGLSEHGQGKLAGTILTSNAVKAVLNAELEVPWPKVQLMRTMATHLALHEPHRTPAAMKWLDEAKEMNNDAGNQRAYAAVRYTIHMKRGDKVKVLGAMHDPYLSSRNKLLSTRSSERWKMTELLQVTNDVYLGAIARSVGDKDYDASQRAEDDRLLRSSLLTSRGAAKHQIDDELMGIPMAKLSPALQQIRVPVLREHFAAGSPQLKNVVELRDRLMSDRAL